MSTWSSGTLSRAARRSRSRSAARHDKVEAESSEGSMPPELALSEFGFTELEARVYCELLRSAPATGYRLAQLTGKAPANVYQALAAMTRKGIVFAEEGETRSYRPLPPSELMVELQKEF